MWSFLLLRDKPHLIKHLYIILVIYCLVIILCSIRGVRKYYAVIGETKWVFSDMKNGQVKLLGRVSMVAKLSVAVMKIENMLLGLVIWLLNQGPIIR